MSNNKYFDELYTQQLAELAKQQKYLATSAQQQQPFFPPKGLGSIGGPVTSSNSMYSPPAKRGISRTFINFTSPERIKADIIERLTGQIANLCTKYNLSDKVEMETEVTMVEINGTTTVTLTATVSWLPNPYVFVAMESYQEPPF